VTIFHTPTPGERIAGRYVVDRLLAEGGFAAVWAARREDDGELVAIKFMLPNKVDDPKVVERFRREAKLLSKIAHENIVRVMDFGVTEPDSDRYEGVPFLVMEHLEGKTLESLMSESKGPMSLRRVLELVVPILTALDAAHRCGVIHRDLKPENIFIQTTHEGDVPKLIDFGICKRLDTSPFNTGSEALTATDQVFGTPEYMSPEQIAADPISPATDLYAVGVILYEFLVGARPFEGATPLKVMLKHLDDPMPELPAPLTGTPIAAIVDKATRKNPLERFASANEMRQAMLDLPDEALESGRALVEWSQRMANVETADLRPPTAITKPIGRKTIATNTAAKPQDWMVLVVAVIAAFVAVGVILLFVVGH
jgi:serine/threonine protein kinase